MAPLPLSITWMYGCSCRNRQCTWCISATLFAYTFCVRACFEREASYKCIQQWFYNKQNEDALRLGKNVEMIPLICIIFCSIFWIFLPATVMFDSYNFRIVRIASGYSAYIASFCFLSALQKLTNLRRIWRYSQQLTLFKMRWIIANSWNLLQLVSDLKCGLFFSNVRPFEGN